MNRNKEGQYSYSNMELICTCGHRLSRHGAEYPHDFCYGEDEEYKQICKCRKFQKSRKKSTHPEPNP